MPPNNWKVRYTAREPAALYKNLKNIIIYILVFICFFPGLFALAGAYQNSKRALIEAKGLYFSQIAAIAATETSKIIEEKLEAISRLAVLPATKNIIVYPPNKAASEAEKLRMILSPDIASEGNIYSIYDSNGAIVFNSSDANSNDYKTGATVDIVNSGQLYISDVVVSKGPGGRHYYIDIYAPVLGDYGDNIGSIHARYHVDTLFDVVARVKFGNTGIAVLINSNGEMLVCPACKSQIPKVGERIISVISAEKAGWKLVREPRFSVKDAMIGYAPVSIKKGNLNSASFGKKKWFLLATQDPSETFGSLDEFYKVIISYCAVVVIFAAGLVFFGFKWILRAQKNYQSELLLKERAESTRHLLSIFRELMTSPLEELDEWMDESESEAGAEGRKRGHAKLKKIRNHLQEMNSIVEYLGYYGHKEKMGMEPVELCRIVDESVAMFDYMFAKKNVVVEVKKPPGPIALKGNAKLLSFVVMNLLLNSVHATKKGGGITIRLEKNNGHAVLAVSDNGEGLSGEDVRKIFDPFYGINNRHKSTGMGLAVTREIVEDHDGEISINSTKGRGTEVTVRLGLL